MAVNAKYRHAVQLYRIHIARAFTADIIKQRWKRKVFARFSLDQIMRNKIKYGLNFITMIKKKDEEAKAKEIFFWYMNLIVKFKLLLRKLMAQMIHL